MADCRGSDLGTVSCDIIQVHKALFVYRILNSESGFSAPGHFVDENDQFCEFIREES